MSWDSFAVLLLLTGYACCAARLFRMGFCLARQKLGQPWRTGLSLRYVLSEDRDDCGYELLWRTQQPALDFLRSARSDGASLEQMTQFYLEFARAYPELADGSIFSDWLDAVQNAGVAVHCRARAVMTITEKGLLILKRLEQGHLVSQDRRQVSACRKPLERAAGGCA